MMTNGKIAVAIAGGYLLGRTKKAKLALGLGMLLAGKKITLDPQQLARAVADSPLLSGLNAQARKELSGAAKTAATRALSTRMNGLADSLHDRTLSLRGEADDERDARDEDEEPEDDEAADEEGERTPPPRKAPQAKGAKAPAGRARKAAASSSAPAKKTAKRAAEKTAKKTAKTAGGRRG
ncbi:hypothetical protein [Streptomyces botrytidirepellens]|uniref:DNA primase n=1 Tax=Streptomyces botrytidirepellens TaxID=2486417 RepID=A0A3M8SW19_9ACTN|nr:hypothetical protein [Streptomyces botrytidirepellens]RNF83050.1 hypothetical protein EEJ42_44770 [Streptomyces botrytidirepellens]